MKYKLFVPLLAVVVVLSGCASLMPVSDKSPCKGFVKTNGDCIAHPINTKAKEV